MSAAWRSRSGGPATVSSASHQAHAHAHAQPPPPIPSQSVPPQFPGVPFPPGYPNAPPAHLPPGMTQAQWEAGAWNYRPKQGYSSASAQAAAAVPMGHNPGLINYSRPASSAANQPQQQPAQAQGQPWMPHPAWQFPADYNPYKRVPKPPDPEYWKTELSDNPLGLENMHITKEFIEKNNGHTGQTPWVWQPAQLEDGDSDDPRDSRPQESRASHHRVSSASQQVARRQVEGSQFSTSAKDGDRTRPRGYSSSQVPPPQSQHQSSSSSSSSSRQPQQQLTPQSNSSTPQRTSGLSRSATLDSYHTPPPKYTSSTRDGDGERSRRNSKAPPAKIDVKDEVPENPAFSERGELRPTFSPAIVRTPKYYSERVNTPVGTPTRSSSTPVRRSSEPSTTSSSSHSRSTAQPPLVSYLTSGKSDILSPLIGATPRPSSTSIQPERSSRDLPPPSNEQPHSQSQSTTKSSSSSYTSSTSHSVSQQSRSIGRSQTYPTLDPVSEDPFSSTPHDVQSLRNPPLTSNSRKPDSSKDPSGRSRTISRSQTYPEVAPDPRRAISPSRTPSLSRAFSPPRSATPSRAPSRANSRSHTPSNSGGGSSLPPPLPPDVLARMQEKHPNAVPTPITVRKGLWNRRGDHLTPSGYIVYAPPHQSNPRELAKYPSPQRAFMDWDGNTVPWDSKMQELPESLPRYGQPPLRPYESFLQYERRWHPVKPLTPP